MLSFECLLLITVGQKARENKHLALAIVRDYLLGIEESYLDMLQQSERLIEFYKKECLRSLNSE